MAFHDIFPYIHRGLGLQKSKTNPALRMDRYRLALLLLANLQEGDVFTVSDVTFAVSFRDADSVCLNNTVTLNAENPETHVLVKQLGDHLATLAPAYTDPLVFILERDPAVFRLRTGMGWVINDALCLTSGNVQYQHAAPTMANKTPDVQAPATHNKMSDSPLSPPNATGQMTLF